MYLEELGVNIYFQLQWCSAAYGSINNKELHLVIQLLSCYSFSTLLRSQQSAGGLRGVHIKKKRNSPKGTWQSWQLIGLDYKFLKVFQEANLWRQPLQTVLLKVKHSQLPQVSYAWRNFLKGKKIHPSCQSSTQTAHSLQLMSVINSTFSVYVKRHPWEKQKQVTIKNLIRNLQNYVLLHYYFYNCLILPFNTCTNSFLSLHNTTWVWNSFFDMTLPI